MWLYAYSTRITLQLFTPWYFCPIYINSIHNMPIYWVAQVRITIQHTGPWLQWKGMDGSWKLWNKASLTHEPSELDRLPPVESRKTKFNIIQNRLLRLGVVQLEILAL